jgi:hypothetical protein
MKTILALMGAILPLVSSGALPDVIAGPILNPANNHVYYLLDGATWHQSEARAVAMGGHLVAINNAAENEWIVDTFASWGGSDRHLWIGLTDQRQEGVFTWANGRPFSFSNWNAGEPNNSGGVPGQGGYEEDFVYIIPGSTVWNDVPADGYGVDAPLYGVVEIQPLVLRPPPFRYNHPSNVRPGASWFRKF